MKSFDAKVAAITGAGSGIGRGLALALARANCHLALSDISADGLAETAKQVAALGRKIHVTTELVNVAKREEVYAWAEHVVRDHARCNLIFNNAGVALMATAEGVDLANFEWIMGINFWGVIYGTKAFLPHLHASGDGHVINISSLFGLLAFPGQSAYNATKFAVRGYTESLRQELEIAGAQVSATCVHPGGIKTNIAKAARLDQSFADLARADANAKFEKMFRTTPDEAAEVILCAVRRNARRVLVGADAKLFDLVQRIVPQGYQKIPALLARRYMGPGAKQASGLGPQASARVESSAWWRR